MAERLDKILSSQGTATRREAQRLIRSGKVTVDGTVQRDPSVKVNPETCEIVYSGRTLLYRRHLYVMLNKPAGLLCVSRDPQAATVIDLLPPDLRRQGLFPAGRLDKTSTGFVLLTDDGGFAHDILAPKRHVSKTYTVTLDTPLTEEMRTGFAAGVTLADGTALSPAEVTALSPDGLTVRVVLKQGMYHQIKRMFGVYGAGVNGLHRDAIGGLALDENLAPGQWRELSDDEVAEITRG